MAVYISLLRGINVGGNKKLPMADLRALYGELGLKGTHTLLQSGNAVFESAMEDRAGLKALIEDGINRRFGFHSEIVLRSGQEIQAAIDGCPCGAEELEEPAKLLLLFLSGTPTANAVAAYLTAFDGPEHLYIRGDLAYIFFPDGQGQSKFNLNKMDRSLGVVGTGRNWNTVSKLATLAAAMEA